MQSATHDTQGEEPGESASPDRFAARRAIVVGASSGMGAELVMLLAEQGWKVGALARREEQLNQLAAQCESAPGEVHVRAHDVLDQQDVCGAFEELVTQLGGLDLLIYAAGIMPAVGRTEYDTQRDLQVMQVNFSGCVAWCNAAARLMGTQRSGTIGGISSIAGVRGRKGNPIYGTSKAAMDHYLEALRNRLSEVGVHVCTIKPGFVETPMTQGLNLSGAIPAREAAQQILKAAKSKYSTRYVPLRWALVATLIRNIPSIIFKRMSI